MSDILLFYISSFSEEEQDAARRLNTVILNLQQQARDYESAVTLAETLDTISEQLSGARREILKNTSRDQRMEDHFAAMLNAQDTVRDQSVILGWHSVASRDGIITTQKFLEVFNELCIAIEKCPSVSAIYIREIATKAAELLEAQFPGAKNIRDAVAHSHDITSSESERHRFHGSYSDPGGNIEIVESSVTLDISSNGVLTMSKSPGRKGNAPAEIVTGFVARDNLDVMRQAIAMVASALAPAVAAGYAASI